MIEIVWKVRGLSVLHLLWFGTLNLYLFSPTGVQDADLSVLSQTMAQCCKNIKETVQMLASRHKDIHGSVSKVGKAIDRVRNGYRFLFNFPWKCFRTCTSPLACFSVEFRCRDQCRCGRDRVGLPRETEIPEWIHCGTPLQTRDA